MHRSGLLPKDVSPNPFSLLYTLSAADTLVRSWAMVPLEATICTLSEG